MDDGSFAKKCNFKDKIGPEGGQPPLVGLWQWTNAAGMGVSTDMPVCLVLVVPLQQPMSCAQPVCPARFNDFPDTHTHSPWIYAHHTLTLSAPYKIIADFLPSCTNSNQLKRFFPFIATYESTTGATPKCQENEQQFVIFAFMIN